MTMNLIQTFDVYNAGTYTNITNISQSYDDLYLLMSLRSSRLASERMMYINFNGDTNSNYSYKLLLGQPNIGVSSRSGSGTNSPEFAWITAENNTANTFASLSLYIPNYKSSTAKTFSCDAVGENNNAYSTETLSTGSWSGTSAINAIRIWAEQLDGFSGTISIYGITKGSGGATVSTT